MQMLDEEITIAVTFEWNQISDRGLPSISKFELANKKVWLCMCTITGLVGSDVVGEVVANEKKD